MAEEPSLEDLLWTSREDSNEILELYRLAVEMADRVSQRRAGANGFFLTLNTLLVGAMGVSSGLRQADLPTTSVVALAGLLLAITWFSLLQYYGRLNSAKFRVINAMERRLSAMPFDAEWHLLKRGRKPRIHIPLSKVERTVPVVFVLAYIALGVIAAANSSVQAT